MAALALSLLGPPQMTLDGKPLAFRYDKLRALLAFLAVEAGRPHAREALATLLWPDTADADARRNLSQALFNLRQLLGDAGPNAGAHRQPYLLASRESIQFNPDSDHSLDVAGFRRLLAAVRQHPHAAIDQCAHCAGQLEQAVELYRGNFLEHFYVDNSPPFEEWAVLMREDLHRQALAALAHLTRWFEGQRHYAPALAHARRQLALEPWREEAHRDVMRLLVLAGHRSDALAQYETCRAVLATELGAEPSAETTALYEQIKRGEAQGAAPPPADAPALPAAQTPFVGRERELEEVARLLADPDCRLLTLKGPGGIGKTRLALQAAAAQKSAYRQQIYFVPLAPVTEPAALLAAIAQALRLTFSGPAAAEVQLTNDLRDRQALLVLDNLEHLLDGAGVLARLLEHAPGVRLLVTSRTALGLQAEWTLDVEGLPVPDAPDGAAESEAGAAALFYQTARRARVGITFTPEDRAAVLRICRRLAGVPLAIELAASWVRVLSCQEIADEIERDLDFLTAHTRDVPERHRSLRGLFEQAWGYLPDPERQALRRLSTFRGGFHRDAAEAVAQAGLPTLVSLVARSLVRRQPGGRYDLHELVRQYSAEHLAQWPEERAAAQRQHAEYYAAWLGQRVAGLRGAGQAGAIAELRGEAGNWHAAWQWAADNQRLDLLRQMTPCLYWFYEVQGDYAQALPTFRQAVDASRAAGAPARLAQPAQRAAFAFLLDQLAWFNFRVGRVSEAEALFAESLSLAQDQGDEECLYHIHGNWGFLALLSGDVPRAVRLTEACLANARALASAWHLAIPLNVLGIAALMQGNAAEAYRQLHDSLRLWRSVGDPRGLVFCLNALSNAALALGHTSEAMAALRDSIGLSEASGDRWARAVALGQLGQIELAGAQFAQAADAFGQSLDLYQAIGDQWSAAQTRIPLGDALAAGGQRAEALRQYAEAYSAALEAEWLPTMLEALLGAAGLHGPEALALVLAVLAHPAAGQPVRGRAEQLRVRWAAALGDGVLPEAQAAAAARPLADLAAEVLALPLA